MSEDMYGGASSEDSCGFFYTIDRKIRRMDDAIVLMRVAEKYPDFLRTDDENAMRQAFLVAATDTRLVKEIIAECGITATELFGIVYRNYPGMFSPCYAARLKKAVARRAYAKAATRGKTSGKR